MIFVYCETCGLRIPNEDVDAKKAIQVEDNRWLCAKCGSAKAVPAQKISGGEPLPNSKPSGDSKRKLTPITGVAVPDSKRKNTPPGGNPVVSAPLPASTSRASSVQPTKPKGFPVLAAAGGAAAVFAIAAVIFAARSVTEPVAVKPTTPAQNPVAVVKPNREEAPPPIEPLAPVSRTETPETPVATPAQLAPPSEAPEKFTEELEKMRNDRAQSLLNDAIAYSMQKPNDTRGLRKKLDAVLRSYRSTPAGEEAFKKISELQQDAPPPPLDESVFANALNAFPYIDLKEDKTTGEWSWDNGALKVGPGRFAIPYDPGGDYDVRVTLSATKAVGPYGIYLRPDGQKQFVCALGLGQDDHVGLSRINGKSAMENMTYVRLPKGPLGANTKHTIVAQMRKNLVRIYVDGQFATQYEGEFSDVQAGSDRALKNTKVLGVFADHVSVLFHSFEIAEIEGKGKFIRGTQSKTETPTETASAKPTQGDKPLDPVLPLKSPASAYETLVWQAYALAAKDGASAAKSRLETARKDKAFEAQAAALALDLQIVASLEVLEQFTHKGVEALSDRRAFKFERIDGKNTAVGKGSKLHVKGVKNGKIILEERIGGASAESQLDLDALTTASRLELARIGAGMNPEVNAHLAAGMLLASLTPGSPITDSVVTQQLENATRLKAPTEFLQHLKGRQTALERERESERLLTELRELFNARKNDDAKTKLAAFIPAAAGTATGEKAQDEIRSMLAELKLREVKPGLWFAYYSGTNKEDVFQKQLIGRVESKLKLPGSLPKEVPKDFWGIRAGGVLRVELEGSYVFQVNADDYAQFVINDLKVGEIKNKRDATFSATLKTGDNPLRLLFIEHTAGQALTVKWKIPGSNDFTEIPDSVLWYDPGKVPVYEQAP